MRIVSISDLVCDIYYDENLNILGSFGGISACNIVCNLQMMGYKTYVYGVCGNDYLGKICIDSLNDCNVLNDIKIDNNINTKAYHILKVEENNRSVFRSIKYCPFCKKSSWYNGSYIEEKKIIKKIQKDDILLFDNLNNRNQYIIDKTNNLKLLDLGLFNEFEELKKEEIIKKIRNKFEIINLNERVEKYLITKLNCQNAIELAKIINAKLLIITRGIKGNDFIYQERKYNYPLEKVIDDVDDSGAGDAFFSIIIKNWLCDNQKYNVNRFAFWVNDTRWLVEKVLKQIGSRTHIKEMYLVNKRDICKGDDKNG